MSETIAAEIIDSTCVLDGDTFVVSSQNGDIDCKSFGLFHADTRFLSRFQLRLNGKVLVPITAKQVDYFSAIFFLCNSKDRSLAERTVSVIRKRAIDPGFLEEVKVENHNNEMVRLKLAIDFDCDFADFFEVQSNRAIPKRKLSRVVAPDSSSVVLTYRRADFFRRTTLSFSQPPFLRGKQAIFSLELHPKQCWKLVIGINLSTQDSDLSSCPPEQSAFENSQDEMTKALEKWEEKIPSFHCDDDDLNHVYKRSYIDLAALRIRGGDEHKLLAAGLPWFMTLFGRDTIIASYQSIILGTKLAETALVALAKRQGTKIDDYKDEQPGKILHELRHGELTASGELPYSPYYGSIDSTILFLILLSEVYRWSNRVDLIEEMRTPILAALKWIERYGDCDGDGFVEYKTKSPKGLRNQGWKDSGTAIQFDDGKLAEPPIALCEVQGYAYDAYIRCAELMRVLHERSMSLELERKAEALKASFNRRFWLETRGYFALGLDRDKRPIDALSSNMGHLLWSGIVEEDRAPQVVHKLMSDSLYSGWGIRTLSENCAGFNPISYHCGTVWPHDNSIIAAGLKKYGFAEEAARIAKDIFAAAAAFRHRLPEVFAGYRRHRPSFPARYPSSCSPQAWASGSALLLLRTVLGIEPNMVTKTLDIDVWLPNNISILTFDGIKAFDKNFRITVKEGQSHVQASESSKNYVDLVV